MLDVCEQQTDIERELEEKKIMTALKLASDEGRLCPSIAVELGLPTGEYRCGICGMLAHTQREADDCCTTPDRMFTATYKKQRANHAAMIYDKRALVGAIRSKQAASGLPLRTYFRTELGVYRSFMARIEAGDITWISHGVWERLVATLGPVVPGCMVPTNEEGGTRNARS